MARPKLAGFRGDGQPYSLTAEKALQDVKHPTIVELQKLDGRHRHGGRRNRRISRRRRRLRQCGRTDAAYRTTSGSATRASTCGCEPPISILRLAFIRATSPSRSMSGRARRSVGDRASARNNGQELTFEGHVRTTIIPQADAADADAKGPTHDQALGFGPAATLAAALLDVRPRATRRRGGRDQARERRPTPVRSRSCPERVRRSRFRSTPTSSSITTRSGRRCIRAMSSSSRATRR